MKKTILVLIFVILGISFVVGYFIGFRGDNDNIENGLTPIATQVPKPIEAQRLWGDDPADTSNPTLLTEDEYLYLYQQTYQAIKSRNFEDFSKLISTQRIWRLNYRILEFLPFEDKMPVMKVEKVDQEQSFYDYAIINMLHFSPSIGQVVVEKMENDDNTQNDNSPMRYINTEEDINMLVMQNGYKHTVTLTCHTIGSEYFSKSGSGKIVFVYDNGQWRFDWQYWNDQDVALENINLNRDFGDIKDVNTIVDFNPLSRLEEQNLDLGETTIQRGETVRWSNVEGIVQSRMHTSSDINWSSPLINKGSFYKKFDEVGIFSYQIIYADNVFTGKILVK